jgi:hypothetical protein
MAPLDDYQDEMERLTTEQIEALLTGEDRSPGPVAALVRDVRVVLLEDPAPEVAARHLAAMAEAAKASPEPAERAGVAPIRRLPRRRGAAALLAAALLLVAGIAAAVTVPKRPAKPEQEIVDSVAPSLAAPPTLDSDPVPSAEPTHGQEVSAFAKDTDLIGCEKGQAVAAVASAKAAEHRENPAEKNDPCVRAESQGLQKPDRAEDAAADPDGVSGGGKASDGPRGPKEKTGGGAGSSEAGGGSRRPEGAGSAATGRGAKAGGITQDAP